MSDISETSYWIKFFTEAGIPPSDATDYALTFTDNRMKEAMLTELNKEYLKEMGITVMGDIIAILKHSKVVTGKRLRQKAYNSTPVNSSIPPGAAARNTTKELTPPVKKSTAATRMLEHYVRKEPPPPARSASPSPSTVYSSGLGARLRGTKRSIEDDDDDEEDSPLSNKRSSVFNRLGADNSVSSTTSDFPKITVTMLGKDKLKSNGESSSPTPRRKANEKLEKLNVSTGKPSGIQLQYHGILKYSTKEMASQKLVSEKLKRDSPSQARLSKADTTSSIRSRLGASSSKPISASEGIFAREFQEIALKSKIKKPISKEIAKSSLKSKVEYGPSRLKSTIEVPKTVVEYRPSGLSTGGKVIKKKVKINKRTGHIVGEESREIRSDVFNRLGN